MNLQSAARNQGALISPTMVNKEGLTPLQFQQSSRMFKPPIISKEASSSTSILDYPGMASTLYSYDNSNPASAMFNQNDGIGGFSAF